MSWGEPAFSHMRLRVGTFDEHGIAVGVEPVALPHCLPVGGEHRLPAGERRDQHQQRALGEVEVGEQRVHHPKAVPRQDEQIGRPGFREGVRVPAEAFEHPDRGGPHCNDPFCPADCLAGGIRDAIPLGFEPVLPWVGDAHRGERPVADVEGEVGGFHAALPEPSEGLFREVEPGGRRGHRSVAFRIDRLVAAAILRRFAGGATDVGRQRGLADSPGELEDIFRTREDPDATASFASGREGLQLDALPGFEPRSLPERRTGQRLEFRAAGSGKREQLDPSPGARLLDPKPRRKDPGVVPDQQIGGPEQFRQVGEAVVRSGPVSPQMEQPGGGSMLRRLLRDPFRRQGEGKIGGPHPAVSLSLSLSLKRGPARDRPTWRLPFGVTIRPRAVRSRNPR